MMWKSLYGKSARDHGTLAFFRTLLRRIAVTADPKKDINACVDLIFTVMKGHILATACEILKVTGLDDKRAIPAGLKTAGKPEQLAFISDIAQAVAEKCTLVDAAFFSTSSSDIQDIGDGVYNYARVFCHIAALIMEFRDAWAEGDGGRVVRCWRLFMPHFKAGHTKYALEALRLLMQVNITLSPNLAHQVMWHRCVNTKGGLGRNIPCDLHNEHVNKLLKHIIVNMGPNLTETALQRAARSVTALDAITEAFDAQSGVPHHSSGHSTRPDTPDMKKVMATVTKHNLLTPLGNREHQAFPGLPLNPLAKFDVEKTLTWVNAKKEAYLKEEYLKEEYLKKAYLSRLLASVSPCTVAAGVSEEREDTPAV